MGTVFKPPCIILQLCADGLHRLSNFEAERVRQASPGRPREEDFNYDKTGNWNGSSFGYQIKVNETSP